MESIGLADFVALTFVKSLGGAEDRYRACGTRLLLRFGRWPHRPRVAISEIPPAFRVLTETVGKKLGKKKRNSGYLYSLFPCGPGRRTCRCAGLPKLTDCV